MGLSFWIFIIAGILYVVLNLDVKRNWEPWTELARLTFFAGLLAFLLGH